MTVTGSVELKRMPRGAVVKLLDDLRSAKVALGRAKRAEVPEYDDSKGYTVRVISPEVKRAQTRFNNLRNDVIRIFGIKATRYDKSLTVKYQDAQQIAERLTPEQAIRLWSLVRGR